MDYIVLWNASLPKAYIRYAQGDKLQTRRHHLDALAPRSIQASAARAQRHPAAGFRSQLCRTTFLVARSSGTGAWCPPIQRECAKLVKHPWQLSLTDC